MWKSPGENHQKSSKLNHIFKNILDRLGLTHFWSIFDPFWTPTCQKRPILSYFWYERKCILQNIFLQQVRKGVIPWPWPLFSGQLLFLSDVLSPAVNVSFKFKSKWPRIKVCQLRRHHLLLRHNYRFYRHVTSRSLEVKCQRKTKRGVTNVALMSLLKFDTLRKLTKYHLN